MTQYKEWPCEHIEKNSYDTWCFKPGYHLVPGRWISCPICETKRPIPSDEAELEKIIDLHGDQYIDAAWPELRDQLLKWKRGDDAEKKETR